MPDVDDVLGKPALVRSADWAWTSSDSTPGANSTRRAPLNVRAVGGHALGGAGTRSGDQFTRSGAVSHALTLSLTMRSAPAAR